MVKLKQMYITHLCPTLYVEKREKGEEIYVDSIPNRTLFLDFLFFFKKNFIHIYNGLG